MIPILYEQGETQFLNNGIGRLTECLSCVVSEERNGVYECEFTYPMTGKLFDQIQEGRIIYTTHDHTKAPQPFEIYKRAAPISGVVTFYAHHISYRLGNVILKPFSASSISQAFATFKNNCITECEFDFWTDKSVTGEFSTDSPMALKEVLGGTAGSILDVYGKAEYEWDKFTVKLYQNRGIDTDVTIRYGKNLSNLQQDVDYSATYSAICPFWHSEETGETVTLPEGIIIADGALRDGIITTETGEALTTENGEPLECPNVQIKAVPMDLSEQFEDKPTESQLRNKATTLLDNSEAWLPDENIEVDFVALWQTPEYESYAPLQRVKLCDTVNVVFPELDINGVRKKVIRVEYDSLMDRYTVIELGQAKTSFAAVLKADTTEEILKQTVTQSSMDKAIEAATQLITGGLGGHVVIGTNADGQPNEILIMDTEDVSTAVNVLRINENGIGFSSNGYEGPFSSAWTLDGSFVADFITTGTLDANLLKAGIITDRLGRNYWNLETGEISISFDPGSGADVTQADLQRVENNARNWANNAEDNAKDYVDEELLDRPTNTTMQGAINASADGLRAEFSQTYSVKGDTTVAVQTWYYSSTSPTQLFGGEWTVTAPSWDDTLYIWEKNRYIKGNGTYTESDPVCTTGHTGKGDPGQDGEDAYTLYITTDTGTSTPKETPLNVTFTAHVQQGDVEDIDPNGISLLYAWFQTRDDGTKEFAGKGKTYSITVQDGYCEDRASVWFAIVDSAEYYYLTDESNNVITDSYGNPLEVA